MPKALPFKAQCHFAGIQHFSACETRRFALWARNLAITEGFGAVPQQGKQHASRAVFSRVFKHLQFLLLYSLGAFWLFSVLNRFGKAHQT